jgi:hypothetical protein
MSLAMPRISIPIRLAAALIAIALTLAGCSRVGIAYNTGDFLVTSYAKDYLDLEQAQLERWEPLLDTELARHRAEELPYLAAYFDQILAASEAGFDADNMACLTETFRDLYGRQASFAVTLAVPLLAELTPAQIERLERASAKRLPRIAPRLSSAAVRARKRNVPGATSKPSRTGPAR